MKKIFNILAAALLVFGAASCQVISEDAFPKTPVAPELDEHASILMTSNTMTEDVVFTWTAYRNLPEGLGYDLYAQYGETEHLLANTTELCYTVDKKSFKAELYEAFSELPENSTFSIDFFVTVSDAGTVYKSSTLSLSIYAYGDAVSPVTSAAAETITLDPTDPMAKVALISWEPARLGYGEDITYDVYLTVPEGTAVCIAQKVDGTEYATTVDALNEAVVAAGGVENETNTVEIYVVAYSETYTEGVASDSSFIEVTTYVATFPDILYVPGSYQGWSPATAPTLRQSTVQKGYYTGFVDLTTEDGSDCLFKFSPNPELVDDFGGALTVDNSRGFNVANGTVGATDNIVVPSGIYEIILNKKINALTLIEYKQLGMIGTFNGWGGDLVMEYDSENARFTANVDLEAGAKFKFRYNADWDYSMGGSVEEGIATFGGDVTFPKGAGNYEVTLDVSCHPYSISFRNTSIPELLYLPGSHNGWGFDGTIFKGDGEGIFEGFAKVGGEWGFKITDATNFDSTEWGLKAGSTPVEEEGGCMIYEIVEGGGNIIEGSEVTYSKVVVDIVNNTVAITPVSSIGVIGSFNEWKADVNLSYDEEKDIWSGDVEFPAGTEYKFRMNADWAVNLGGVYDNLVQGGPNLKALNAGTYHIELSIATVPYTMTITPDPNEGAAAYASELTVAGSYCGNSWSPTDDPKLLGNGYGYFQGPLTMTGDVQFKFVHQGSWIGGEASLNSDTGEYEIAESGSNITLPEGSYFFKVDLASGTKLAIPITKVGIMGSFNSWTEEIEMTFDAESCTYAGTVELAAGAEFKIRFNSNWDYSLGGDVDMLSSIDAGNIIVDEAGTYTITLSMGKTSPKLTITK